MIVQHSTPDHPSHLVRVVAAWTPLRVREATAGTVLEPGTVYVTHPAHTLAVDAGVLVPGIRQERARGAIHTVDTFLESLAEDLGPRAIAVILSGTGSDGTAGAVRIKQAGGMVLV